MIATTNWAMPEDYPEEYDLNVGGQKVVFRSVNAEELYVIPPMATRVPSKPEVHTVQIDAARAMELQALFNKPEDWN